MLLKMGCGCSKAAEDVQRYHEMMGSCDVGNGNASVQRYSGLSAKVSGYGQSSRGGLY